MLCYRHLHKFTGRRDPHPCRLITLCWSFTTISRIINEWNYFIKTAFLLRALRHHQKKCTLLEPTVISIQGFYEAHYATPLIIYIFYGILSNTASIIEEKYVSSHFNLRCRQWNSVRQARLCFVYLARESNLGIIGVLLACLVFVNSTS